MDEEEADKISRHARNQKQKQAGRQADRQVGRQARMPKILLDPRTCALLCQKTCGPTAENGHNFLLAPAPQLKAKTASDCPGQGADFSGTPHSSNKPGASIMSSHNKENQCWLGKKIAQPPVRLWRFLVWWWGWVMLRQGSVGRPEYWWSGVAA